MRKSLFGPAGLLVLVAGLSFLSARAGSPPAPDVPRPSSPERDRKVSRALSETIVTIVDKAEPSPTGDPHDYVSYARYYWPDPSKPDGLPFIQRDGHPDTAWIGRGDSRRLDAMIRTVEALADGWVRLRRPDCPPRADTWIRAWFLDPATRLKPEFNYAQIRMGREGNRGSASGLIDTRGLLGLSEALAALHGAPGLSPEAEAAARAWFAEYLDWLLKSKNGQAEHRAKNNHGSWYLAQAVAISLYLGKTDQARALAREDFDRIDWQIDPDGRQPLETARVDGLSYSLFNLEAQLNVARLAAPLGVNLWAYTAPRGGSLKKALSYLRPYDSDPRTWPHNQLAAVKPGFLGPLLQAAASLDANPEAGGPGAGGTR